MILMAEKNALKTKRRIGGVELADQMKSGLTRKFLSDLKEIKKSRRH